MSFDLELIDSDLSIKSDGTVRTVNKTAKLKQDVIKIILTPLGSVKFHEWYGSNINEDTIGHVLPDNLLFHNISSEISDSINRLRTLQRAQSSYQRVDAAELIISIAEVDVQRNPDDPRQVNVRVKVISQDLSAVTETFTIGG